MHHNNATFSDKKSFMLNDLLKLRVRNDPVTGKIPTVFHGCDVNARKRQNMFCTVRPFNESNCNKILTCVMIEQTGITELFQRHTRMMIGVRFLVAGHIATHDNAFIHVSAASTELQATVSNTETGVALLPSHSPELNLIELVFNVIAQQFKARCHEFVLNTNHNVLAFLHKVIDSITPDIIVSCYQKCICVNYF